MAFSNGSGMFNGETRHKPGRDGRQPDDPSRALGSLDEGGDEGDEEWADAENEIVYLDEAGNWALLLPDGVILHAHGMSDAAEDEAVFFECEPVNTDTGSAQVRCAECGATLDELTLEAMIDALDDQA